MYRVILNNNNVMYTIHNSNASINASKLSSGKINNGINTISSFEFDILPNNIGFNELYPYLSKISVINEKTNKTIFNGRILKVKPKMNTNGAISKSIICESQLAYLCDSIQPYEQEHKWITDDNSTGLEKYVDFLLDNHNKQVEDNKKIYRGIINVKTLSSDNSVDKGTNYQKTFDVIKEKLINVFGGEIQLREVNHKLYLDYLDFIGEESTTDIEIAKNMKSIDREIDYSEIFTRIIPLGAKLKTIDEAGNEIETEERLTISSVNNNIIWLDTEFVSQLGVITKIIEFNDITKPENLLSKAREYIKTSNVISEKNTLSAVDLSLINNNYDEIKVGNIHNIKNSLLELNQKLRIIKSTIDICKPTSSTFNVGDKQALLSNITNDKLKDITNILQQISIIKSNYVKNEVLSNTYSKINSIIIQKYNEIVLKLTEDYVSNSSFSNSLKRISEIEMLINKIELLVSEVSSMCGIANGNIIHVTDAKADNALYFSISGYFKNLSEINPFFLGNTKYISNKRFIAGTKFFIKDTLLHICVDRQNKDNPTSDLKVYEIDIKKPLLFKDDKKDLLEVQLSKDNEVICQITRYFKLDQYSNIVELDEPTYEAIDIFNIELFDGGNYIYLKETDLYNLTLEYLTNSRFNKYYASYAQLQLTKDSITLETAKKYSTKEESKASIKALADTISLNVKNGDSIADITLNVNGETKKATINMTGLVKFSNLSTAGDTLINGSNITTGTIDASIVNVKNLNASNITSGEIDAAIINVKNINADKITGGTITASAINLGNGTFSVTTAGKLTATGATINGVVKAGNGSTIGGLTMSKGVLSSSRLSLNANVGIVSVFNENGGSMILSNAARLCATAGIGIYSNSSGTISAPSKNIDLKAFNGASVYLASMRGTSGDNRLSSLTIANGEGRFAGGTFYVNGTPVGSSSSKNMKKNIKALDHNLVGELYNIIHSMNMYKFDYKKKYIKGQKNNIGFIIEDIEDTILAEILHVKKDEKDKNVKYYSNNDLTGLCLLLIKELMNKYEMMEKEMYRNGKGKKYCI